MSLTWIITGIAALLVVYLLLSYNGLVRKRNQVEEAWSDIDVQLKRRHNLIPNIIETVKGYATHERQAFESVTAARARSLGAGTPKEQAQAENALTATLKTLFAVTENYPDLKANANFLELQRELADTENKIQAARRFYNSTVRDFNTALQSVPTNVIANLFNFKEREFFEVEDEAVRSVPKVDFNSK